MLANIFYDESKDFISVFDDDCNILIGKEQLARSEKKPFVMTSGTKVSDNAIKTWLTHARRPSFVVIGEDGCGKESLIRNCFETDNKSLFKIIHCSANTSLAQLEFNLWNNCIQISSSAGKVLKPKEKENLVIYLKSPNLLKPDIYGTSILMAFLEQILTYGGYYDKNFEWITLENIQVIFSNKNTTLD